VSDFSQEVTAQRFYVRTGRKLHLQINLKRYYYLIVICLEMQACPDNDEFIEKELIVILNNNVSQFLNKF